MSISRNATFNFLGAAAPALISIVTIPYIVSQLGAVNFGLLTLTSAIIGYFALLDINVTAGSTKYIAEYMSIGDRSRVDGTATFGFLIYLFIGLFGMVNLYVFSETIIAKLLSVPKDEQALAVLAVQIAALGFLFGQVQAYLQSLPGAIMRFDVSAKIEATFGVALPVLTVALLYTGSGLIEVICLRVLMSAVQAAVLMVALNTLLPGFRPTWPTHEARQRLLNYSVFAFLSRIAAVTYTHADKLLIGARVGMDALTQYALPTTLTNRVMSLVFRLSGVMLPHSSSLAAAGRNAELEQHYLVASRYMFYINGGISITLAALSEPILKIWLTPDFALKGAHVMSMIAMAQFVDSLTNLPSLLNDGLGHPKVTGTFALARAAVGLGLIIVGVNIYGIEGAAAGHLIASIVMSGIFLIYSHGRTVPVRLIKLANEAYVKPLSALLPIGWVTLSLRHWAQNGWIELTLVVVLCSVLYCCGAWILVLRREDRNTIIQGLRVRFQR